MDMLSVGKEVKAGITVRGYTGDQAISMAKPHLDEWQSQQSELLPSDCHFEMKDNVSPPSFGQQIVTRTLKVVANEEAS